MKEKKVFNKLIRDKIPEIIENSNSEYQLHVADDYEYKEHLLKKLLEEVNEMIEDPCVEELADILEVIDAIKKAYNISEENLLEIKNNKANARGAFEKKLILEYVYKQ